MKQQNHLTDQEITKYVKGEHALEAGSQSLESHIASCDHCRLRLLESERRELGVQETDLGSATPFAECPPEDVLQSFAIGMCEPGMARQIVLHVAECSYCAPLLKAYLTEAEEPGPAIVPDAAEPAAPTAPSVFRRLLSRLKLLLQVPNVFKLALAGAGGVALVLGAVVTGPIILSWYQLHRAEKLVAAAFQEVRPNAMRLPGVAPAPFGAKKMSPGQNSLTEYPNLADAVQLAAKEKDSTDPRWLKYRGEVKLLAGEEDAPDVLAAAIKMGLDDPGTKIDLAVADFQRDTQIQGMPPNLGETVDLLGQVLKDPRSNQQQKAVALFDLAVAYQRMHYWDLAVDRWEQYLRVDPSGSWHDEAQHNLEDIENKKKIPPPKPQGYRTPNFFLQHLTDADVLQSLEEYQSIALRTWFPEAAADQKSEAALAVRRLAELLEQRHQDPWMKDFLNAGALNDLAGLQALSAAMIGNRNGRRHLAAEQRAQEAVSAFRHAGNYPGVLRAGYEALYANQRILSSENCVKQATILDQQLLHTGYPWLQLTVALVRAVCLNLGTHMEEEVKQDLERARQGASASGFRLLGLRIQAMAASIPALHDCRGTWQQAQIGLEQYWQGPAAPERLFEFYSPITQCWTRKKLWYAAEAMQRRLITILENEIHPEDQNLPVQAFAHLDLEHILAQIGEDGEAEEHARLAIRLLEQLEEPVARNYQIPVQLELADLQLDRGKIDSAMNTVQEAEKNLASRKSALLDLDFYRVHGDVQVARQHWKEAEGDYEHGIEIAERGFSEQTKEDERERWIRKTSELYSGLAEVFLQEGLDEKALQLLEFQRYRQFALEAGSRSAASAPRWAQIEQTILSQALPPTSVTRLVYASTRNHLYILALSGNGLQTTVVNVKRDDLKRRIREYVKNCSIPTPFPEAESKILFSWLIQPVFGHLRPEETVVVDLDSVLHGLPLEALKSPQGWYFGERFPVVYSPGYLRESDLRRPAVQRPRTGVVVDALGTRSELEELAGLFPELQRMEDPALTAVDLPGLLEDSEAFIFIGHAKSGALILSDQSPITAENFPPESLKNLQLVVLAACSTGVSAEDVLDTNNLVHAFQSGGTPSVLASQWDVDSPATRKLVGSFYRHLKNAESVAHALYRARKEVIQEYKHPYYWAGFVLSGRA